MSKDKTIIKKNSIYDEYLNHHKHYIKKFGEKIIVLMQVGMFYESYSTNTTNTTNVDDGPNLDEMSKILNITKGKKNNAIDNIDETNPYLLGFPIAVVDKYINILMANNYNVIIVDQVIKFGKIEREVTHIFSPSTFIDTFNIDSKGLMIFFVEYNNSITTNKKICSIGMALINISIGSVIYYESHSESLIKENNAFDEAHKFYHNYRPAELIIYEINGNIKNKLIDALDILPNQVIFSYEKVNPNFCKINYQNNIFQKVYNYNGILTPLEYLNIGKMPMSIIALIIGFDYIHQHNEKLTNKLSHPILYDKHINMILYNNAQYQLNIIDYNTHENINSKFQSLYEILNNCCTPMGKRLLKTRLCAPLTDIKQIKYYYELSDKIMNNPSNTLNIDIRENLKLICDMEKIYRKIIVQNLQPTEMYDLYMSLIGISNIIKIFINNNLKSDIYEIFCKKNIKELNNCIELIDKTFNVQKLKGTNSFYLENIYPDLDILLNKIKNNEHLCDSFASALNKKYEGQNLIIKHNETDGHYLSTTLKKGEILEKQMKQIIEVKDGIFINNEITIVYKDLQFKYNKNVTKIICPILKKCSTNINEINDEYNILLKKYFNEDIYKWYNTYENMLCELVKTITTIDYVSNNIYTSIKYHYTKPEIIDDNISFIEATELRHPIIERLIDSEYIPHDIILNNNKIGALIYGTNGSGKSILMKTIGLCLIIAQCGLYVPSKKFKFGIFNSLFTRITGNDNLFNGESTFVVEMKELKCILKNANEHSLVIGDEVCKGTEYLSGNALVAAAILKFSKLNIKFLFATHLHDLSTFNKIQQLENINFFYIDVEEINDELIYSRKLMIGTGPQIYGIIVAKYILDDPYFINDAIEFKNELLEKTGINSMLVNDKKSIYNKDIYMDKCYFCDSKHKLEAHHINFQTNFIQKVNGLINNDKIHLVKNDMCNLIVLCSKCHDKIHSGKINIDKMIKTSNGTTPLLINNKL